MLQNYDGFIFDLDGGWSPVENKTVLACSRGAHELQQAGGH